MIKSLRVFLCLFLCAMMLPLTALAGDCFVIDVDSLDMNSLNSNDYVASHLSAQTDGVRVRKYISDSNELAAQVRLTVTQAETSTVVFDKNYGYVSGTFDSGDIFLPYVDNNVIPYLITLNIEDWTYAMPFMHLQPRLSDNRACTYGVRLQDYNPSITNSWVMGTMLDLNALRQQGTLTLPLCASNLYLIGQATLGMSGNLLTVFVDFDPSANVEVLTSAVYLFGDVHGITTDNVSALAQPAHAIGETIDTTGLSTALLYLPITLSYDSSGLTEFSYDLNSAELSQQLMLWQQNAQGLSQEVVVESPTEEPFPTPGEMDTPSTDNGEILPDDPTPEPENNTPEPDSTATLDEAAPTGCETPPAAGAPDAMSDAAQTQSNETALTVTP